LTECSGTACACPPPLRTAHKVGADVRPVGQSCSSRSQTIPIQAAIGSNSGQIVMGGRVNSRWLQAPATNHKSLKFMYYKELAFVAIFCSGSPPRIFFEAPSDESPSFASSAYRIPNLDLHIPNLRVAGSNPAGVTNKGLDLALEFGVHHLACSDPLALIGL
jgi:hypothetical protein